MDPKRRQSGLISQDKFRSLNRIKKKLARFGITSSKTISPDNFNRKINTSSSKPGLELGGQGNYCQNCFNTFKNLRDRMLLESKSMSILVEKDKLNPDKSSTCHSKNEGNQMTQKFISPEKSEKSSGWSKTDSKQSVRSTKENGFHTVRKGDRKALSPDPKLMSPPAKSIKSYDYMSPQATSTKLTESKKDRLRSSIYTKENKNQDISVICLDEKMGLTNDDLYEHLVHNHELISIEELIREVNTVLNGVELNCKDLLQQKNKMLKACEDHKNFIEYDKSQFLKVQRKKIDELHDYLEKKYSNIIVEYNKSIEKDLLNISNNKNRIIREIEENIKYINEVKKVKDSFLNSYIEEEGNFKFKEPNRLKIIRNFLKARKFFIDYKKMKRDFEKKIVTFKSVFDSEVLNQKSSLSVEYDTYIEEVYKKIMEVPTVKNSLEIYDGTKMDEKNIPKEKIKRMPQARKIRIPRWNTMLIAEYEIDNKFWTSSECNSDIPFFPFCGIVYLSNKSIVIMGGFNDKVENRKTFSSKVLRVEEKKINFFRKSLHHNGA